MRISITIPTASVRQPPSSAPPLVQLGAKGELLLLELQGELGYEGDPRGRVVGILDFERMDKPTLHLGKHHLLHGKIVTLPRPVAVIRRQTTAQTAEEESEGELVDEAAGEEEEATDAKRQKVDQTSTIAEAVEDVKQLVTPSRPTSAIPSYLQTPTRGPSHNTAGAIAADPFDSSPINPVNRKPRDYSSDLSSPFPTPRPAVASKQNKRKERDFKDKAGYGVGAKSERTRSYEVVSIVRKKVVFALRPEPIVTATVLPE
ncbi:hypothetical protein QFC21_002670 [Naganishia friedmannii]|uniref:Uncharacterized protein n=1 Tax=Naganishia friedmannii TaxID=89922 RepID=A0ACC2VXV0_9TREE|nr:hypothetical protein QFC21_002670 [Naganishia friedmannii]